MMNKQRPIDSRFALRVMLLASSAILGIASADMAKANPLSPTASDAGVSYAGLGTSNTNVGLDQQRTIIDWRSFNISSGETTRFFFGGNNWIVLNRVSQGSASINGNLYGCLDASCGSYGGNIWVYAADGVLIGPNARVNAGGFLATTSPLATSDSDFLAGTEPVPDQFDFGSSISGSSVQVAAGAQINGVNGSVALIAPQVTTATGSSVSASGTVLYAAALSYRIKFAQDSSDDLDLVDFEVPAGRAGGTDSSTPITVGGNTTAGKVFIASVSKADVANAIIDVSGSVTASSASKDGGDIVLSGDGDVNISGQLSGSNVSVASSSGATTVSGSVTAQQASGVGGNITVTAPNVVLASTSKLDASGTTGGTILVGGDVHGGADPSQNFSPTPVATANTTTVVSGATIKANGTAGAGGKVVVWSNSNTNFAGSISATGNAGDGGFVETSGGSLQIGDVALVDTRSTGGATGQWLLDPTGDFTIATSGGNITPATVVTNLASSNQTYSADNDLIVSSAIDATTNALATHNLIFEAGRSIDINANITLDGGSFLAKANDSSDGLNAAQRSAGAGGFTMMSGVNIDTSKGSGSVTITIGPSLASSRTGGTFTPGADTLYGIKTGNGTLSVSGATSIAVSGVLNAGSGVVDLVSTGGISESGGTGSIIAGTLTGSSVGGAFFDGPGNSITTLGNFSNATSSNFVLTDAHALTISGTLDNQVGNTTLTTTGAGSNLVISGTIKANGHTLTTTSSGTIDESAGTLTAATIMGSSVGGGTFTGTNLIGTVNGFTNTGASGFSFKDGTALDVTGNIDAGTGALTLVTTGASTNGITLGANLIAGAATGTQTVTLTSAGAITETTGTITADKLTGSSVGATTLNKINDVGTLAGFSAGAGFFFTDDPALTVSADINSGTGDLTLTTTGASTNGIILNANLIAGAASGAQTVTLTSAGAIVQTAGTITAATLTGSSVGGTTLNDANQIATLNGFTNTSSGNFSFVDAHALMVSNTIDNQVGNISLTATGGGNSLTVDTTVNAGANTASFNAAGDFVQNDGTLEANAANIVAGGNILIGEKAFTDLAAVKDPSTIDQAGTPFFTPSVAFTNHVFIEAQNVSFTAPQRIVMENTGTPPTAPVFTPEGFSLNHSGVLPVAIVIGGSPQVVDIFGELVQNGLLVDPRSIASTTQVQFAPGTVANNHYRVNGCIVHQIGVCTIVSFDFKGFEPAKLAELVLASASGNEDIEEDLTITGAGNDEIWAEQ